MCWWSFTLTQHRCVQFNTLTGCSCLLIFSALRNRQCTRMYACAVHPVHTYVNTCSVVCVCARVFELEEALCPVVQYRQKVDEILSLPTLVEFQVICAWSYHVLCILSVRIAGRNIFARFLWQKKKKRKEQRSAGLLTTKGRTIPDTLSLHVSVLLYLLWPFCHAFNYPTVYMRRYFITRERHAP